MNKVLPIMAMLTLFASISVARNTTTKSRAYSRSPTPTAGPKVLARAAVPRNWTGWSIPPCQARTHAGLARADFTYDDWIRRTIKRARADRVLVSKGDFVTTSGEKGYKLVWVIKSQNGSQYVINNYLFQGKGDTQVQLSGTVDAANADKFAPIFDGFEEVIHPHREQIGRSRTSIFAVTCVAFRIGARP